MVLQGVKVILFTKYLWADQAMDWFRHGYTGKEADGRPLRADAVKDPCVPAYYILEYIQMVAFYSVCTITDWRPGLLPSD